MERFYYENKLSNQNITAKSNIAWAADGTEFELVESKKLYAFLCSDIHTNSIIGWCTTDITNICCRSSNTLPKLVLSNF
jgi:hypothetical protein